MSPLTEQAVSAAARSDAGGVSAVAARLRGAEVPLRVLHVLDHLDTGGTEYGVLKLVNGLPREKFESRICVVRGARQELATSPALDGRVFYAGGSAGGAQFSVLRLARVFRQWRPDIVHSRNWGAIEAIPAARFAGVPVVIHSEHGYELDMLKGLPLRRRLLRRWFYGMTDAIFSVTRELSAYHARQVGRDAKGINTIYNGVDTERFHPDSSARQHIRQELGLPESRFVIGSVGRLVPIKDYNTLLKATQVLASRGIDVTVLLAGSGPERDSLAREAGPLGDRVRFLGGRDDVPQVLNALDVFVLTSICEGMSNTILEAMASGLPVLATAVGGNPELVKDGVTGSLFSPGDVISLSAKLTEWATDAALLQRIGAAARGRAVAEFGLARMLSSYQELYLHLAARRGIRVSA